MKKIFDIQRILLLFVPMLFITSCSEKALDEVNRDRNHSTEVNAKFILADVITRTAFYTVGGDFNTYLSAYTEHEVGVDNQLWYADIRQGEPTATSTFNNVWNSTYSNLKNARIAIARCSKGGVQEGNNSSKGIAEILVAINAAVLADMFGDIPYSQAALIKADGTPMHMNPKIDKQEEVYKDIMKLLDNAISDLNTPDDKNSADLIGSYDFLYGGDKAKWIKLANGLKARYTMRLIARSTDVKADMDKVLDFASKSFKSADDEAAFNVYTGTNINPLYDFYSARSALGASQSLINKFVERNDPRMKRSFVNSAGRQVTGKDSLVIAPNGASEQSKSKYGTSIFVYAKSASTMLMSYHELLFLQAEAYARKDMKADAQKLLKQAVVASIANAEKSISSTKEDVKQTSSAITPEEAEKYFDDSVLPLFTANPLQEIMIQKYLGFFGASGESTECYSDIRRLKALKDDFIALDNPKNKSGQFPLRCPYGSSETTTNPAVESAYGNGQYVYTENVWWAGGNR